MIEILQRQYQRGRPAGVASEIRQTLYNSHTRGNFLCTCTTQSKAKMAGSSASRR